MLSYNKQKLKNQEDFFEITEWVIMGAKGEGEYEEILNFMSIASSPRLIFALMGKLFQV